MNLVLLEPSELRPDGTVRLGGRRAAHVLEVLRAAAGDRLRAGVVGGRMGDAEVVSIGDGELVLRPALDEPPPPPSPVALLLALPRPKILRRVLQAAAAMGVKRIALVGSWRVEKSYFASPFLEEGAVRRELLLGLEQGRDTVVPEITIHRFFKPFVEDVLEGAFPGPARLLAHPAGASPLDELPSVTGPATLGVGPEGGWTAYEAERLAEHGFVPFTLGPRVLRVDAAVPFAVGQLELWLRGRRELGATGAEVPPLPPRSGGRARG